MDSEEITRQIAELKRQFLRCRATFPYVPESAVGHRLFETSRFYTERGFRIRFERPDPLTPEERHELNAIAAFLNESYLVRLFSLLESHNILSTKVTIEKSLPGSEEVDILRRLRHQIAHDQGRYDPQDSEGRRLYERVAEHFRVGESEVEKEPSRFPTDVEKVIEPLTAKVEEYVRAYCAKRS